MIIYGEVPTPTFYVKVTHSTIRWRSLHDGDIVLLFDLPSQKSSKKWNIIFYKVGVNIWTYRADIWAPLNHHLSSNPWSLLIPFAGTSGQDLCLDMTATDPPPLHKSEK